jgi:signal transduction histidine kinase
LLIWGILASQIGDKECILIVWHDITKRKQAEKELTKYRIRQVILNLLNNAMKFTKIGGIINLRAHTMDGNLMIEVEDNGYGIATKDEQRLFEPYFASKRKGEHRDGLGLGLPLGKLLIDGHGGQIRLESKKGRGTVFRFSIPIKATQ